jgi:hypothetical protein
MANRSFILRVVFLPKTVKIKRRWEQLVAISPTPFNFFQHEKINAMERQRSFLFFSCDKSQEIEFLPTDKNQNHSYNDLVQQLKDDVPFDQLNFNFSDENEVEFSPDDLRGGSECDCAYRIVSATIGAPDANATSHGVVLNYLDASGTSSCSNGCFEYLSENRTTDPNCYFPSSCTHNGTLTIDPFELIPFNCSVPRNTTGPFNYNFLQSFTNNCVPVPLNNFSSLTIQIFCSEKDADPNCRDGQGYGFASDLITVDVASGVGLGTVMLEIGGECGCTPIVI